AFATLLLTCCVVIGIQNDHMATLGRENATLRAQAKDLDALRAANLEVQRLQNENAELDRLQKDKEELARLRDEAAQLLKQAVGLDDLRASHQKLLAASGAAGDAPDDFLAEQKSKADRVVCVNNLKQIGVAIRIWENDHKGTYPTN